MPICTRIFPHHPDPLPLDVDPSRGQPTHDYFRNGIRCLQRIGAHPRHHNTPNSDECKAATCLFGCQIRICASGASG